MNAPVFNYDYKKACEHADRAADSGAVLGFIAFLLILILCAAEWPSDECVTDQQCQEMESGK